MISIKVKLKKSDRKRTVIDIEQLLHTKQREIQLYFHSKKVIVWNIYEIDR